MMNPNSYGQTIIESMNRAKRAERVFPPEDQQPSMKQERWWPLADG